MLIELEKSIQKHSELAKIFGKLNELGLDSILVGGAVRDFFYTKKLGHDFDFEVHKIAVDKFISTLKNGLGELSFITHFETLPFSILRAYSVGNSFEFSLPRLESYSKQKEYFKHSEFDVSLYEKLDIVQSFSRRDFTINAIGVSYKKSVQLKDPYDGLTALQQRTFDFCTRDCFKDPVRFLRLVRFATCFHFQLSERLEKGLPHFDLRGLSRFHFIKELLKSKDRKFFLNLFYEWIDQNGISTADYITKYRALSKEQLNGIRSVEQLVFVLIQSKSVTEAEIFSLSQEVGIKKRFVQALLLFHCDREAFHKLYDTSKLGPFSQWIASSE